MKTIICLCLCIASVACLLDMPDEVYEDCPNNDYVVQCFDLPCYIDDECPKYGKEAKCSNYMCKDHPCSTVWRVNGEIVTDCWD